MRTEALHEVHASEAGQLDEYHQWELPAVYTSVDEEFDAATQAAALTDLSFFGRMEVTGADRLDLLHRLSTNDLLAAKQNGVVGTLFTTDKGRLIDYASVVVRDNSLMLIVSPNNEGAVAQWIDKYCITEDVKLVSVTDRTTMVSLIGPQAKPIAGALLGTPVQDNCLVEVAHALGRLQVVCVVTTKAHMVHIIVENETARQAWSYLSEEGKRHGLVKMGSYAYEAFRVSRGIPAHGAEISESFNPYEAGLREAISFTKGCYIGQEVIARLDTYQKIRRKLVGLVLSAPLADAGPMPALIKNGAEIGCVTSSVNTPVHGKFLGLGILGTDVAVEGESVLVSGTDPVIRGVIINPPMSV